MELQVDCSVVGEARADPAEVATPDRHCKRAAPFNITACGPTFPGEHDSEKGGFSTGSIRSIAAFEISAVAARHWKVNRTTEG